MPHDLPQSDYRMCEPQDKVRIFDAERTISVCRRGTVGLRLAAADEVIE
jgi:hypothetical protein